MILLILKRTEGMTYIRRVILESGKNPDAYGPPLTDRMVDVVSD